MTEMTVAPIPPEARGALVLVVNDNELARHAYAAALRSAGFVTETLGHGAAAVWRRFRDPVPAVTVMDWSMPMMSGRDAIKRIRAREASEGLPRVPIVLESTFDAREAAASCGADAALTQQGMSEDLIAAVLLAGWPCSRTAESVCRPLIEVVDAEHVSLLSPQGVDAPLVTTAAREPWYSFDLDARLRFVHDAGGPVIAMAAYHQLIAKASPGGDAAEYLKEIAREQEALEKLIWAAFASRTITDAEVSTLVGDDQGAVRQLLRDISRDAKGIPG
jgi:CheY-like chemotaxis protein